MDVSIIIVSYNSQDDLVECLDSVIQACPDQTRYEILVVDNDSQDASRLVVQQQYPMVRLLENSNTGYAGGNNYGAAMARGEYLLFLNPDTVVMPGAIDALVAPFKTDPTIGLTTACLVHHQHPQSINACGNEMHYTGLTYCRGANQPRTAYQTSSYVDAVSGAACAIRRSLFTTLGGFDQQFFMYVEDSDLSLRVRLYGLQCFYVADAVIQHKYHMKYTAQKAFLIERNRYSMLIKNFSPSVLGRLLPGLLLAEVITGSYFLLRGPQYWSIKPRLYQHIWRYWRTTSTPATSPIQELAVVKALTSQLNFQSLHQGRVTRLLAGMVNPLLGLAHRFAGGWA
ncbi:glycosyl transferase family 2 (plasmid) [Herpetosiphon aurantiacus DSM 785]|uniref:Glycosyl transferase family 2 n=1 Tax=Herpetosiphon aurantiacus (strain ATCC 23779 / DSM 785 / 114-95) TaxID=316274 RepID=A9B8R1_HERA2|nr:glycosyl transferase family 2 [Herpetosiphon aurantiacus DSM 785]